MYTLHLLSKDQNIKANIVSNVRSFSLYIPLDADRYIDTHGHLPDWPELVSYFKWNDHLSHSTSPK